LVCRVELTKTKSAFPSPTRTVVIVYLDRTLGLYSFRFTPPRFVVESVVLAKCFAVSRHDAGFPVALAAHSGWCSQ